MSLGMFSAVPLPSRSWDEAHMGLVLPCLPLIGGLIGALWWGAAELLSLIGIHIVLTAAVLALMPFISTGFLHIDGYMDTSDAVLSRRPIEEKQHILKDPHTGAFAVIMVAVLLTLQFAAVFVIVENGIYYALLIVITVISRCCAALSILSLKVMPESGFANMFKRNTGAAHIIFVIFIAIAAAALSFIYAGAFGLAAAAFVVLSYIAAMAYAYRNFNGVSGDLAGFAIVISEVCGLIALAVI